MRRFVLACAAAALAMPAAAAEHVVTMGNMTYAPAKIAAKVGDTLRFVNDDFVDHNVFVPTAGYAFDLGKQEPGKQAAMVVRKAGRFEVECVNHPMMLLDVTVQK